MSYNVFVISIEFIFYVDWLSKSDKSERVGQVKQWRI